MSRKRRGKELTLYLFRKKQIRMIFLILILFSILTGVFFHIQERRVWLDDLTASSETIADQVVSIYELHLKNVQELCLHSAAADSELLFHSGTFRRTAQGKKDIVQYLTSLSVANEYIYSSYLYFPADDLVFSSYSLPSAVTPLESFSDREIFAALPDSAPPILLDPRPLPAGSPSGQGNSQVITMLLSVPLNTEPTTAWLAVNIDARRIYTQIIQELHIESHPAFYILGADGEIIFDGDASAAPGASALAEEGGQILSVRAGSDWLGWTFVLENELPPVRSSLLWFLVAIICILAVLLIVSILLTYAQTAPIREILQTSRDLRWRYFLTSGSTDDASLFQFDPATDFPDCRSFCTMSFRLENAAEEEAFPDALAHVLARLSVQRTFRFQTFRLGPDYAGAALGFGPGAPSPDEDPALLTSIANEALDQLENLFLRVPVCCISSVRNSVRQLPAAWLEVSEMEKYSWSFRTPLRCWTDIARKQAPYEFPMQTEKQLVNTLLAGSSRDCLEHSHAIFSSFLSDSWILENAEIQKYLYIIQNDILSRLASLPLPVRTENSFVPEECRSLQALEDAFGRYLLSIFAAISSRDTREKESLNTAVIAYIDRHYRENTICLNMVSEQFHLTNGQVSRIVRETTGKNFSVYVTEKRIEKSKELLLENRLTINEISDYLGFSYPYYFIRKFRELEGITPGQYTGQAPEGQSGPHPAPGKDGQAPSSPS